MATNFTTIDRRTAIKTSALTLLGLAIPGAIFGNIHSFNENTLDLKTTIPKHFPNIDPEIADNQVGKGGFSYLASPFIVVSNQF